MLSAADPIEFWMLMAALLAAALYLLRQGLRAFWRLRTIADTPAARIRSASQGYLELSGIAGNHHGSIPAPLTDTPCVWYRYRIQKRQDGGRNRDWTTVEEGTAERPFRLDDGTGQCLVEPAGAQLKLHRRVRWEGPNRDPRQRQARFAWLGMGGRYRFTEERIHEGDPVYLLGRFETPRRGVTERERLQRALLRVWKRDPERMRRFDRNGDGQISLEAWERARQEAARVSADTEDRLQRKPILSRVVDTGEPDAPFLISTYPVEDLVRTLRWQALGLTAGSLAIATFLGLSLIGQLGAP